MDDDWALVLFSLRNGFVAIKGVDLLELVVAVADVVMTGVCLAPALEESGRTEETAPRESQVLALESRIDRSGCSAGVKLGVGEGRWRKASIP